MRAAAVRVLRILTSDCCGATAVELALASPALFAFVLGVTEVGRMLWLQNALDYAVAEAARCAALACSTDIPAYAAAQSGAAFGSSVFSYSAAACGNQVTATYPFDVVAPFVNLSVTLSSQACFPT